MQKKWQKEHREQLNAYSREYRKRRKEKGGYEKTDPLPFREGICLITLDRYSRSRS